MPESRSTGCAARRRSRYEPGVGEGMQLAHDSAGRPSHRLSWGLAPAVIQRSLVSSAQDLISLNPLGRAGRQAGSLPGRYVPAEDGR